MTLFLNSQVTTGIGKEASFGAGAAPGFYIPTKNLTPDDVNKIVPDAAWRGAPADGYGYVSGPTSGTVPFGGDVFPDAVGFPFAGVLGDVVASGSAPTTWTMAVLNTGTQQPASYCATTTDGVNSRRWPGLKFSSVTLSASASQTLQYSATAASLISTTTTAPTPAWTTVRMQPAWIGAHQIGGSSVGTVLDCSVKISRQVDAKRNNDGSPAPYLQRSGICSVSGSLTLILQTDTYRAQYVAGTSSSLNLNWAQGAGASATQVQVHCSDIWWTDVQPDYLSSTFQQVKLTWVAAYNATDAGASGGTSPVKVTLKNAVTSGTY